ncbi:MAG: TIGR00300 family protein [Theionarchaea archaeon]|nr:TIGR00300 family protein [Theionarchaea archaeon]
MVRHRRTSREDIISRHDENPEINDSESIKRTVRLQGHIVDSGIMASVLDTIIRQNGKFQFEEFEIGKTNIDPSVTVLTIITRTETQMDQIMSELTQLGAFVEGENVRVEHAPADGIVPDTFYSTTNHRTAVMLQGTWVEVDNQMMDSVIVVSPDLALASCRKPRYVKRGDLVVVGRTGIHVMPMEKSRRRSVFDFMGSGVSSERNATILIKEVADVLRETKTKEGKICAVAGPAVVHTGGYSYLASLIRKGYIDCLLSGNALAVHDIENALYGTSLGISLTSGKKVEGGHRHHMAAINEVNHHGGIRGLYDSGRLTSGIFYECLKRGIDYALAGSLRDDGPLLDVISDSIQAQERYRELLDGVNLVLMLATMLHSIAVGNMLPSYVRTVCVDIHADTVTKLADRGSFHAVGIVTDVSLFLRVLDSFL